MVNAQLSQARAQREAYLLVNFFIGEAETQAVIWGSIDQGEAEWRQEQPKHKRKPTHLWENQYFSVSKLGYD
ncbi:rCG46235 [Rattus norvegicus]|uniref:RCG46235 n=1 Tax=Rattus norvegicus TaxID=10116 RepID=A6ICZ4_RAT|nr:rCG46235 [Rattus norvegicus]